MGNSSSSANNGENEKALMRKLEAKNAELEAKIAELNNKSAELNAKQKEIENRDRTIADKDKQITEDSKKLTDKDKTINDLNKEVNNYKQCDEKEDKLMIALRRYQSAPGFIKMLFDNKDWLMYIVNDFDKNWKTHKWFKYIWNIAFKFKNTTNSIVIFGAHNNGISPVRSPANFKRINKGFIDALAVDPQLTAYNMDTIITNPLLASKYTMSFWGGHRQKPGDDDSYSYVRTLQHDQTGDKRHANLNQTAWMWNWVNTTVYDPKNYPKVKATPENVREFTEKGRIIGGNIIVNKTDRNAKPDELPVNGFFYAKRPTAAG